jgi:hypothetical protein
MGESLGLGAHARPWNCLAGRFLSHLSGTRADRTRDEFGAHPAAVASAFSSGAPRPRQATSRSISRPISTRRGLSLTPRWGEDPIVRRINARHAPVARTPFHLRGPEAVFRSRLAKCCPRRGSTSRRSWDFRLGLRSSSPWRGVGCSSNETTSVRAGVGSQSSTLAPRGSRSSSRLARRAGTGAKGRSTSATGSRLARRPRDGTVL